MSDTKISAMTAASALSGPELLAGVQGGANVKITATQIQTFAGSGLTIGTTTVTSGTTTRFLYDLAGVVSETAGLTYTAASSSITLLGPINADYADFPSGVFVGGTLGNIGTATAAIGSVAGQIQVRATGTYEFSSGATIGSGDVILTRATQASLQHGAADADTNAAIVAQTIRTQGTLAGGTADQAGKDWTFIASPGKGTGVGGKYLFQAAKAGNTGTVVNTPATVLTLDSVASYGLFPAGTALAAPLKFTSGPVLTTAAAGAVEFDGVQFYNTIDANNRAAIPAEQYFHLTGDGGNISTIGNFFGATSNITLVSGAYYVIDIHMFYLKTTSGAVTWTLTNSANPTNQNIYYEMSPIAGVVAPPGTATMLAGQFVKVTSGTHAFATGNLATAVDHYARFKIFLDNSTGVSLKIQATTTSGTLTPRQGSYWFARRVTSGSVGTFVA